MFQLLQIDDDPMDARLLGEAMGECHIDAEIRVATDGVEGLEFLRSTAADQAAWRPDLIVCDLNMPRMSGHAFLSEVKADQALRHIPVIILSSSGAVEDIAQAYDLHANCFIRKPVAFDELCVIAQHIGEFWLSTVALPGRDAR